RTRGAVAGRHPTRRRRRGRWCRRRQRRVVGRRGQRARPARRARHRGEVMRAQPIPGPSELLPGRPDAVLDLQSREGCALVDATGSTVVFETVVDDYAEVWVDGELPIALGDRGGHVAAGFNAPNRVVLTRDACPGQRFVIAVFGINGPISASPHNYIWMRTA